jgi:5-formyltetrahydrofolate cyclo-ligase
MIAGTALGVINSVGGMGALTGVFGGNNHGNTSAGTIEGAEALGLMAGMAMNHGYGYGYPASAAPAVINEDHYVNRYELGCQEKFENELCQKNLELAQKDAELALAAAKENTRGEMISLYEQIKSEMNTQNAANNAQFAAINQQLGQQAVQNQANKDSFQLLQERMETCTSELHGALEREVQTRKCNDNLIVTYTNATFYPKMVANVTTGTTTTAQALYNPLPACDCNC